MATSSDMEGSDDTISGSSRQLVGVPFSYDNGFQAGDDSSCKEKTSLHGSSVDFISSSEALKTLWAIPFIQQDTEISVVVHNLGGTLLIDTEGVSSMTSRTNKLAVCAETMLERWKGQNSIDSLSFSDDSEQNKSVTRSSKNELTLKLLLESLQNMPQSSEPISSTSSKCDAGKTMDHLHLPPPEFYTNDTVPTPIDPTQYIPWEFSGLNLVVGSDAIILPPQANKNHLCDLNGIRPSNTPYLKNDELCPAPSRFNVWFADAKELRSKLQSYEIASTLLLTGAKGHEDKTPADFPTEGDGGKDDVGSPLHSRIVASPSLNTFESQLRKLDYEINRVYRTRLDESPDAAFSKGSSSAVVTVLDAYLDTIIANVPQLALCLYEKGFVQSLKLFDVNEIHHLSSDCLDGPVHVNNSRQLFSPEFVDTNASMLLNFLKSHCSQDDSTYLLRKNSGETNIRLFNVSALSSQRRQQWLWWLAMTSYRFAIRLKQFTKSIKGSGECSTIVALRSRQRNLLRNALELLEEHSDIAANKHGTITAAINESLADTYLSADDDVIDESKDSNNSVTTTPRSGYCLKSNTSITSSFFSEEKSPFLPYRLLRPDGLTKAQDYLVIAIENMKSMMDHDASSSSLVDFEKNDFLSRQLYGLYHKLINVLLQLSRHHLKTYSSSNAMQTIRMAGRQLGDVLNVIQIISPREQGKQEQYLLSLFHQSLILWQYCGLFSRSYAADGMWRDRGHLHGDDIIALLLDVQNATTVLESALLDYSNDTCKNIPSESADEFDLNNLTGILKPTSLLKCDSYGISENAIELAKHVMDRQKRIKRDERRVLVAATYCFVRAIKVFEITQLYSQRMPVQLCALRQWYGDACNEVGKLVLIEVKTLLSSTTDVKGSYLGTSSSPCAPLLLSAESWFIQALDQFSFCEDKRNIAVIRCNLAQCSKLRANAAIELPRTGSFSNKNKTFSRDNHSENFLQDAIYHLELAHIALDQRDLDAATWDMVSEELAATYLILGVKRRQSILGGGSNHIKAGEEKVITQPMQQAVIIYEQLQNQKQAAAANYQLALYYSKVWSSQVNEAKTREKLEKAFQHYQLAHAYFFGHLVGNESTFIVLCIDLSQLYSSIPNEAKCLITGLLCCVDTCDAFLQKRNNLSIDDLEKMSTLSKRMDENIFSLLLKLVKLEKDHTGRYPISFKDLYRNLLSLKMDCDTISDGELSEYPVYKILVKLREVMKVFKCT